MKIQESTEGERKRLAKTSKKKTDVLPWYFWVGLTVFLIWWCMVLLQVDFPPKQRKRHKRY